MSGNNNFATLEDYIAFWREQPLETLRAIATEHMGGYNPADTHAELVATLTKGMEAHCAGEKKT